MPYFLTGLGLFHFILKLAFVPVFSGDLFFC